jgi:hypothetical protein
MALPLIENRVAETADDGDALLLLETISAILDRKRWEHGVRSLNDLDDETLAAAMESAAKEAQEAFRPSTDEAQA